VKIFVYIIIAIVALLLIVWLVGFIVSKFVIGTSGKQANKVLGPMGPDEYEQSVGHLSNNRSMFGILRLTSTNLLFASREDRPVLTIPLDRISSVEQTLTPDLPGASKEPLKRPVLKVTFTANGAEAYGSEEVIEYFIVSKIEPWLDKLTPKRG